MTQKEKSDSAKVAPQKSPFWIGGQADSVSDYKSLSIRRQPISLIRFPLHEEDRELTRRALRLCVTQEERASLALAVGELFAHQALLEAWDARLRFLRKRASLLDGLSRFRLPGMDRAHATSAAVAEAQTVRESAESNYLSARREFRRQVFSIMQGSGVEDGN